MDKQPNFKPARSSDGKRTTSNAGSIADSGNGDPDISVGAAEPLTDAVSTYEGRAEDSIFRSEFLRAYRGRSQAGQVLRVSPRWVNSAYWLLICLGLTGLACAVFGQVREYASGPAVIRFGDRANLTALSGATISAVLVRPGETVTTGQVLVRFYSGPETAEFEQADREFQLELVNLLRDPSDQSARESMARLRSERDKRLAQLEGKVMRAPIDGTVSDVRIRPGQHLESGDPVMAILGSSPKRTVIAVLPGNYRPLLRAGLPIRLQLTGYPYVHQNLKVSAIGDEIVGPGAIRRYLGGDIGDAVPLSGPAVLVYAELPTQGFVWDRREREYYDGMQGMVQVRVKTQSVLLALIPGLRDILARSRG